MKRDLEKMSKKEYDVLIIGGGINGAAIAHDASLRGLNVALVEKKDFGCGTTSATTKLAHGGLRYLKNFEFGLVKESLKERKILERIAPHLVYPMPFLVPLYKNRGHKKITLKIGMLLYDFLSSGKKHKEYDNQKIHRHKMLSAKEVIKKEPRVLREGLVGAARYYDCQISSPERLCLEFILTADSNGADVSNYAEVDRILIKNNKAKGVVVKDKINGNKYNINAKIVINALGPWLDKLIKTYDKDHEPMIRGTKGIHIITKKICNNAILFTTKKTNRAFFVLPWNNYTLIGTTDVDFKGDLDDVHATKKDIQDLINEVNEVYDANLSFEDVMFSYAGIRPLIYEPGKKETEVSRKYEVRESDIGGLITIIGGKLTTARGLAERAVDIVAKKLGKEVLPCKTEETPLYGSTIGHIDFLKKHLRYPSKLGTWMDKESLGHLINTYGSKYEEVLKCLKYVDHPSIPQKIIPNKPDIKAQVFYALEKEMALTIDDFMLRRTNMSALGCDTMDIYVVGNIMKKYFNWDAIKMLNDCKDFENKIKIN